MELIAIKKNNKYYIRNKTDKYSTFKDLIFNQDLLPSFSDQWLIFEYLPSQIRKKYFSYQKMSGHTLKPGFAVSELTPASLPANAFDYGENEQRKNFGIYALYDPTYELIPEKFEDIPFTIEVIDEDCEPLFNPKYPFITDFPYFIDNHEAVRHKYPCHLDGKELYNIIRKYIKDNLPDHCKITSDYDFHLCVELIIPLIHEETQQIRISKISAKKQKFETRPLRSISFPIIDIGIPGEKYGKNIITKISGTNYIDLESKIDSILQEYKEKMNQKLTVCSHCKGYGFMENK